MQFFAIRRKAICREEIGAAAPEQSLFCSQPEWMRRISVASAFYTESYVWILWTIQHEEAYLRMVRNGVLRADRAHLFGGDEFLVSYNWMSQQMRMRICEPPHGVQYPVWLWHTWEGKRKRPDMRKSAYAAPNTPIVLLMVEIPDEMVLLSDFDRWNIVMNGCYVAIGADDDPPHSLKEIC